MVFQEILFLSISFIILYFLYRAYIYLTELESCDCAPFKYVENLRNIELIYLVLIVIGIFMKIVYLMTNYDFVKKIMNNSSSFVTFCLVTYACFVSIVFVWYLYNIYEFNTNLKSTCECSNGWQNNILYVHALYMSMPIILGILSVLFDYKVNISLLVLIGIVIFGIFLYENYVIKSGITVETYMGMLKDYQESNNVFFPKKIEENTLTRFETTSKMPDIDYSPKIAQPNQKYRQIHPDEYPQFEDSTGIHTPLSSHESIINQVRQKMVY